MDAIKKHIGTRGPDSQRMLIASTSEPSSVIQWSEVATEAAEAESLAQITHADAALIAYSSVLHLRGAFT